MSLTKEQKQYQADYYQRNRELKKERARAYYQANKDKRKAYLATRVEKDRVWNRNYKLERNYGITLSLVHETIEAQHNHCPICRRYFSTHDRRWHVDHCHNTGQVRGVICTNCNTMLGQAQDNANTLRNAADYLEGKR